MRKLSLVAVFVVVAACGGSSKKPQQATIENKWEDPALARQQAIENARKAGVLGMSGTLTGCGGDLYGGALYGGNTYG